MRVSWSPPYVLPLPEGHRFPMAKYGLIPEQLLYEGTLEAIQIVAPHPCPEKWILRTHDANYWQRVKEGTLTHQEVRRIGFPQSPEMVHRERLIAQGTFDNAIHALTHGVALNVAGGTHHAFADAGEGFCILNDIAIAANRMLDEGLARKVLVIDLDVHQGNGTAKIFENVPQVFTWSVHGANNFPSRKTTSDLDTPLPDGTGDAEYLAMLSPTLLRLLDEVRPDFIFYLAGVDVLATDRLGKLSLTREGCRQRDRTVLQSARERGLGVAVSMGGGYSPRLVDIVEAHCNTYREASRIF